MTPSGITPTEDEFNHARAPGKPIFVFVQRGIERDAEQEYFVGRVGGGWEHGAFTGFFSQPSELALGVVKALTAFQAGVRDNVAAPAAQQRASNSRQAMAASATPAPTQSESPWCRWALRFSSTRWHSMTAPLVIAPPWSFGNTASSFRPLASTFEQAAAGSY